MNDNHASSEVVPLGIEPPLEPPPPRVRTSAVHRLAVVMMSVCAAVGAITVVGFVTVGWPGRSRRIVIAVAVFALIGFLASTAIAVLGAARDTYPRRDAK